MLYAVRARRGPGFVGRRRAEGLDEDGDADEAFSVDGWRSKRWARVATLAQCGALVLAARRDPSVPDPLPISAFIIGGWCDSGADCEILLRALPYLSRSPFLVGASRRTHACTFPALTGRPREHPAAYSLMEAWEGCLMQLRGSLCCDYYLGAEPKHVWGLPLASLDFASA